MTKSCNSTEQRRNGDRRSIGMTEILEFMVAKLIPGVMLVHDGSKNNGDIPTDVFVRRYKLPPQVLQEITTEGPIISFIYHRRDGWASVELPRRDIKAIDSGEFGEIIRNLWNTRLELRDVKDPPDKKEGTTEDIAIDGVKEIIKV